jgi:hypothetical protein
MRSKQDEDQDKQECGKKVFTHRQGKGEEEQGIREPSALVKEPEA